MSSTKPPKRQKKLRNGKAEETTTTTASSGSPEKKRRNKVKACRTKGPTVARLGQALTRRKRRVIRPLGIGLEVRHQASSIYT